MMPTNGDECKNVLVQDVNIRSLNRTQQLAWLSLITEEDYNRSSRDIQASASYMGFASGEGSYSSFDERRREYLRLLKFGFSSSEAFNLFSARLSPEAISAWTECMRIKNFRGAAGIVKNYDANNVVIEFYFMPSQGPAQRIPIKVTPLNGTSLPGNQIPKAISGEVQYTWAFARKDPHADFRLVVNVGNGTDSLDLTVPAYVPPEQPKISEAGDWVYINPKSSDFRLVGEVRTGEVGFLVMSGAWGPWGEGGTWFPPEQCCMTIAISDRTTGVRKDLQTYRTPYVRVSENSKVYIQVGDTTYTDNATNPNDPLRAKIFYNMPPLV